MSTNRISVPIRTFLALWLLGFCLNIGCGVREPSKIEPAEFVTPPANKGESTKVRLDS